MNKIEHYKEAEKLLLKASIHSTARRLDLLLEAQIHATLAASTVGMVNGQFSVNQAVTNENKLGL